MNKYDKYYLFLFQVIAHIALVWSIFNFSLSNWGISFFVYFLTGALGVSITYHRLLSHNSFVPKENWEKLGTLFAFWGLVGSSIAWVNNHKTHHRYTDQDKDPHSPIKMGFFTVQFLSMFHSATGLRYVVSLVRDKFHLFLHKNYYILHAIILLLLLSLVGWKITAMIYLTPAALLWNAGSFVNSIGHLNILSYRNHETNDNSQNNIVLGYLMWGEGWHNNHHNKAAKAKFGEKWWEFDISYFLISKFLRKPTE